MGECCCSRWGCRCSPACSPERCPPCAQAGPTSTSRALKEGGRGDGAIGVGTRRLLIVCEVALSLVLLMGAGVMIQSLLALRYGDTGFDPNNVLTMDVRLVDTRYPSAGTAIVIL